MRPCPVRDTADLRSAARPAHGIPPQPRGKSPGCRQSGVRGRPWLEASSIAGVGEAAEQGPPDSPQLSARPVPALSAAEVRPVLPGTRPLLAAGQARFFPIAVQAVEELVSPLDPRSKVVQCDLGQVI